MDADTLKSLVQLGVLGPVLAALASYCWRLHSDLRKTETLRTADAQAVTNKLIELNNKWIEAISALGTSAEAQREVLREIREMLGDLRDTMIQVSSRNS